MSQIPSEEKILEELEKLEEEMKKKGGRPPKLTDEEVVELYRQYKFEGKPLSELAALAGVSTSTLRKRFKKLEESGMASSIIGVGSMHGPIPTPKVEVQVTKKVASDIASDALKIYQQIYEIGKYVYRMYSTTAYNKGVSVYEFVDNAVRLYLNWELIREKIYSVINRLIAIIEKQRKIISFLAPRASPMIRYEVAAHLALELLDRKLLLKLLGVKTPSKQLEKILSELDRELVMKLEQLEELGEEYGR